MALTSRTSPDHTNIVEFHGAYAIKRGRSGKLRIYEDATVYSASHGGQCIGTGKVIRDYSPTAGAREGQPAEFTTLAEATAYIDQWLSRTALGTSSSAVLRAKREEVRARREAEREAREAARETEVTERNVEAGQLRWSEGRA